MGATENKTLGRREWGEEGVGGGSHSQYDNHVLNYVKSERAPPSAGMSLLAQGHFIALASLFLPPYTGG